MLTPDFKVLAYQLCSSAKTCFIFLIEASISSLTTTRYRDSDTVHRWRSFTDFSILEPIQKEHNILKRQYSLQIFQQLSKLQIAWHKVFVHCKKKGFQRNLNAALSAISSKYFC